ncbi:MAG: glycosyltransferase family 2 protein [Candidatus Pacebacteria bacterium]|nr:glycosyltransferase family 2 protein [Candidatus Paceibacterota bacterium]
MVSEENYLNITRASDLSNPKERALYRFFETLPALLSLGTLLGALIFSWIIPVSVAFFIIVFDFFWFLRIFYLAFHQTSSFRQMKRNLKVNWLEKLEKENPDWQRVYHLIILPSCRESKEIIKSSLESLIVSNYPKEKMIVALAIEERMGENDFKEAKEIEEDFKGKFFKFIVTSHPEDMPGEIAGKGSNVAFALNEVKDKIVDPLGIPYENIVVSSFDIDTKPYPYYFANLTWNYLNNPNPFRSSYQPIPVYNNNVWEAPAFSRVIATSGTFWQMMQQERPEQLVTYSAHAFPFKVFIEAGYPSNIVADDSHVFWKAYFKYDGDYKVVPLYYPISMDAVLAESLKRTAINQYKQQRRWAWGCVEIPYLLFNFLKRKKIPMAEKIRHSFTIIDGFWSWATSSLLVFILGWLPLWLGGDEFQKSLLSYNLPKITSYIMSFAMIGMLASAITSLAILPPKPATYGKFKKLSMVFQWFLLPITLIVFGNLPALDAQIRLLLGKYMGFWVTEKHRK